VNLGRLRVDWAFVFKLVLPSLFVAFGTVRLIRHFSWDGERLEKEGSKAGLLGGLFWSFLGTILLLDTVGYLEAISFFGQYWPVLLILYGLGKVVDFYRLNTHLPVRAAEVFGVVFIVTFGFLCNRLSDAHFPLIDLPALADFPVALGDHPSFEFVSEETIEIDGAATLEVNNLYGEVRIAGSQEDSIQVRLTKTIRSEERGEAEKLADSVTLVQERKGSVLQIRTNRLDLGEKGSRLNTHLSLQVPASLKVNVSNRYGNVALSGLEAGGFVSNAYGAIKIENAIGDFEVENRYEDVTAQKITGNLVVMNERGSISVNAVSGNADLRTQYAGIRARQIGGAFLGVNHFGSVDVEEVKGTVSIRAPGSQIRAGRLQADVSISASHRPVRLNKVGGSIRLDSSYNEVTLNAVSGRIDIQGVHCRLTGKEILGGLEFEGKGSRLSLTDIQNGIRIRNSLQDVRIEKFSGPLSVQNEFAPITVIANKPPRDAIELRNRNGVVRLTLPARSEFHLIAEADGGRIRSDFGATTSISKRVEQVIGSGGPLVTISTRFSDIEVRRRG